MNANAGPVAAHLGIDLSEYDTPREARAYLRAWAKEDFYVPLADEMDLLERAGFIVDIAARRHSFAVVVATR